MASVTVHCPRCQ
ncbi:TPA: hypothetical protein JZG04_004162, partial [Escherichia coli]|nr:hypothetical protein [Escherichia coli]MBT0725095.1 hypothetical protein [Rosenbergiella gaditana]EMC0657788.1 hypothetical protein [Escherichia coli]HAV7527954.1 hypothetical protein [Escherichia coli]HAW8140258.1 hypothetical protein [Escherichia coli]